MGFTKTQRKAFKDAIETVFNLTTKLEGRQTDLATRICDDLLTLRYDGFYANAGQPGVRKPRIIQTAPNTAHSKAGGTTACATTSG
jgi:hypothetical protein